jgi:hypothetical protein
VLIAQLPERHTVNVRYPKYWLGAVVNTEGMFLFLAKISLLTELAAFFNGLVAAADWAVGISFFFSFCIKLTC